MAFEHDRRYKRIFSQPYFLQKLLESFVHESFIKNLDFSTLERIDKSFINADFNEKESDLIFTIHFKGKIIYIFLLLEFQSTVDKLMPIRFLRYIMELYESFRTVPENGMFPAVFPVLLYSGDPKWTAKEEISVLIEKSVPKEYIPKFKYYPIFINEIEKKSLEKIKNAVSALFYIENSNPEDLEKETDILIEIIKNENLSVVKELVEWFNNYLTGISGSIDKNTISFKLESIMEVKTMFATKLKEHDEKLLEQGIEQGIERGIERGIEQGIERGIEETAVKMLRENAEIPFISRITGIPEVKIMELKKNL